MEEYRKDYSVIKARKMLEVMSVSDKELSEFDALCKDFDLTVSDVTGWEEDLFFNPQEN